MRDLPSVWALIAKKCLGFHQNEAGKALLEHVLLLAMILGSLVISLESLSQNGLETFSRLALVHESGQSEPDRPQWSGAGLDAAEPMVSDELDSPGNPVRNRLIFAIGAALLLTTLGVNFLHGRKRRALLRNDAESAPGFQNVPVRLQARYLSKRQDIWRGLAGDAGRLLHNQLIVAQIMSRPSGQAAPDTPALDIAELMRERQTHHVLICSSQGDLLGVVSDRDLAKGLDKTAGEIMARDPITTTPEASVSGVVSLLLERRISSMPVVLDRKLVGIVTMSDIAMTLQCSLQLIEQLLQQIEQDDATKRSASLPGAHS